MEIRLTAEELNLLVNNKMQEIIRNKNANFYIKQLEDDCIVCPCTGTELTKKEEDLIYNYLEISNINKILAINVARFAFSYFQCVKIDILLNSSFNISGALIESQDSTIVNVNYILR